MTCPECGESMELGEVSIRSSIPAFFFVGLSYQPLYWYPSEGRREELMKPGARYEANRCPNCGTLVVPAGR